MLPPLLHLLQNFKTRCCGCSRSPIFLRSICHTSDVCKLQAAWSTPDDLTLVSSQAGPCCTHCTQVQCKQCKLIRQSQAARNCGHSHALHCSMCNDDTSRELQSAHWSIACLHDLRFTTAGHSQALMLDISFQLDWRLDWFRETVLSWC